MGRLIEFDILVRSMRPNLLTYCAIFYVFTELDFTQVPLSKFVYGLLLMRFNRSKIFIPNSKFKFIMKSIVQFFIMISYIIRSRCYSSEAYHDQLFGTNENTKWSFITRITYLIRCHYVTSIFKYDYICSF